MLGRKYEGVVLLIDEKYFNKAFEKEIPVELLLNQKDESIFISDDQPYSEYFLIRRYNDYKSGSLRFIK